MATKKRKSKRASARKVPAGIHYYDAVRNWRKIARHLDNVVLQYKLAEDFHKYTYGRWRENFVQGQYPREFESCDWYLGRKGRAPAYWLYVKHAACHWVVNFNLILATLVEPKRKWRILSSQRHSTVWDGDKTLFDFNFQALKVGPAECFTLASETELSPGEFLKTYFAPHFTEDDYNVDQ